MVACHRVILVAAALSVGGVACRKPPTEDHRSDAPPPPADHLAPGEIPEGTDRAFSLVLPRASHVFMRFPEAVHVRSPLSTEQLSHFVRARVRSGRALVGATVTTFEDVVVPTEPTRHLTVEIRPGSAHGDARSEMVVKDVTPPPAPAPNESEAELRRKAGLTPDGKLLDPKRMQ